MAHFVHNRLSDLLPCRVRRPEDDDPLETASGVVDTHQTIRMPLLDHHRDLAEPLEHLGRQRVECLADGVSALCVSQNGSLAINKRHGGLLANASMATVRQDK